MEMRWTPHLRYVYSKMSGELFVLAASKGYESVNFVELALNTWYGHMVYDDIRANEWLADTYLLAGYEREFGSKLIKGPTYPNEVMWFCGYLYRYWGITEDRPIQEIYKIAPFEWLAAHYGFYHTQGEEYVIEDIKERRGMN